MKDSRKTKLQLIAELEDMRRKISQLPEVGSADDKDKASQVQTSNHCRASIDLLDREGRERVFNIWAESSPDLIFYINSKPQPHYEYVSPNSLAITGYSPEEFYSDPKLAWKTIYPDDLSNFKKINNNLNRHISLQLRWRLKGGGILWTEVKITTLSDDNGNPIGRISVIHDISAMKKAEQGLIEREEFGSHLLNESPNAIIVTNPDSSIRYINPAFEKLTGYSAKELVGIKAPYPYWPEEDSRKIRADLSNYAGINTIYYRERWFQSKNGERFLVSISANHVYDREASKQCTIVNWVDITDQRKTENALRESEDRYRSIAENVHDGLIITSEKGPIYFEVH